MNFIKDASDVLEVVIIKFFADEGTTIGDMITNIKMQTDERARRITIVVLEQMDKSIKINQLRKNKYNVIRTDEKTLLSTVGELKFKRCYYQDKTSGNRVHLLDKVIGITNNTKKTEDVVEMCIAIRTMIIKDDIINVQSGAGIVADSDPEKEYEETINKAQALVTTITK